MSSAKKGRQEDASCSHVSSLLTDFFHRAKARERDGAKRNRACTADSKIQFPVPPKAKAAIQAFPPTPPLKNHQEEKTMPVIEELIRSEADGTISFGNYKLPKKSKLDNFEHRGDLYKVKTFNEITKLERNGMFVYESVPGTTVSRFTAEDWGVEFQVEGDKDVQITVQLEDDTEYAVTVDGVSVGGMVTNMSGKLNVSVELSEGRSSRIRILKR